MAGGRWRFAGGGVMAGGVMAGGVKAGPTYLFCLGATKAGTSWLWDHLASHPECHFRTIKEYNFFFLSDAAGFDAAILQGRQKIARQEAKIATVPHEAWAGRHLADLRAWQRLLERRQVDLDAYRAFLTEGRGARRLVGDITPAYGLLGGKRLRVMMDLADDVRFLYLIRDPLARLWSHVRMVAAHQVGAGDLAMAARGVLDRLLAGSTDPETKWLAERGDYPQILTKLDRVLAGRPFRVQVYEDMMTAAGLAKLSQFLGISAQPGAFGRVSHQGVALALPDGYRARLLAWLRPHYEFVAARFGALPEAWQHSMKEGAI